MLYDQYNYNGINWVDPDSHITTNFTVKEAVYLRQWNVHHWPTEEEQVNMLDIALALQSIRHIFNRPVRITS